MVLPALFVIDTVSIGEDVALGEQGACAQKVPVGVCLDIAELPDRCVRVTHVFHSLSVVQPNDALEATSCILHSHRTCCHRNGGKQHTVFSDERKRTAGKLGPCERPATWPPTCLPAAAALGLTLEDCPGAQGLLYMRFLSSTRTMEHF